MLPALIIKAIVPKILSLVLKQFPGIERIDKLIRYMDEPNDADKEIEKVKKLILDKDLKIHEQDMRINRNEDMILELQKKINKK